MSTLISAFNVGERFVDEQGRLTSKARAWTAIVAQVSSVYRYAGSPEGNVEAPQDVFCWDTSGNALYFKAETDIGGDASQGWVAV